MNIKRYDMTVSDLGGGRFHEESRSVVAYYESDMGDWVSFTDHEAVLANVITELSSWKSAYEAITTLLQIESAKEIEVAKSTPNQEPKR